MHAILYTSTQKSFGNQNYSWRTRAEGIKIEVKIVGDLVNAMVRSWPEGIFGGESVVLNSKVHGLSTYQRYCASHSV